jgi:NAD(P)H-nitrite reductase large subunit
VVLAAGVRPEAGLARSIGLEFGPRGGIKVDAHMRTSDPLIYAAGDMATPFHQVMAAAASGLAAGSGINADIVFSKVDSKSQS